MTQSNAKERLLQTAVHLFQIQGYHATGLNQVLRESGAPKGSLYYHFPGGKEQLALESLQVTRQFVLQNIEDGLRTSSDPTAATVNLINDLAERFEKDGLNRGIPIASLALESTMISEEIQEECQKAYRSFQQAFKAKLVSADYEAEHADELSVVLNSMIEGAFLISYTMGNSDPLKAVARQIPAVLAR